MDTTLDLSRWRERPRPVSYRCWTIASLGLRQLLKNRFFRFILMAAWGMGLMLALTIFVFSQTVASGGWLETLASNLGSRIQAMASAFGALALLYPDIVVQGIYTLVMWGQSYVGLSLSLLALTLIVPQLIAKDQASNALTIYLSRPLTSLDYLLGKFGIIVGVVALMWTGPLVAGWLLSLLLAPSRDFLVYSSVPLGRALLFNGIGLLTVSTIAMGVSSLSRSSRNTILLWLGLWLILGMVAKGPHTPLWLRHASFSHNLSEIRTSTLRVGETLATASRELPLMNKELTDSLARASTRAQPMNTKGAAAGLAALVLLSSILFFRKLRAE